jgi:DNA-directed RNA polymerase beta' subunit
LETNKPLMPNNELAPLRAHLYDAVGAVFGVNDPVSPTAEKRGAKGFIMQITGTRPGNGFFQAKLMKRQQDVSGRATIAPDPTLGMDELGVPEDMLWGMYAKFVIGRLVTMGYPAQKKIRITVVQQQEKLFQFPLEFGVLVNGSQTIEKAVVTNRKQEILLNAAQKPTSLQLDPLTHLLFQGTAKEVVK